MVVHSLLAIVLGSNFVVAIADNVPRYDVKAGCLGAAKQMEGRVGPDTCRYGSRLSAKQGASKSAKHLG